ARMLLLPRFLLCHQHLSRPLLSPHRSSTHLPRKTGEVSELTNHASTYMPSIIPLYFSFTNLRLSFMVGVSSSSSAVSCCSISRNFLIVSTRAKPWLTRSISELISSTTSRVRQSEAKSVNGTLLSWACLATLS